MSESDTPESDDDSTSEDLEYLYLKAVLSGKVFPEAAKRLLQLLGVAVLRGEEIAAHHRHWLGYAISAIGIGADPSIALRLRARQGRPQEVSWIEAIFFVHPKICEGKPWTTVCQEAAVELGYELGREVDEKTIRTLYERHFKPVYESLGDDRSRTLTLSEFGDFVRATEQAVVPGYPFVGFQRKYVTVRRKSTD